MRKRLLKSKYAEIYVLILLYVVAVVIYYTTTWVLYGGFQPGHPPYFSIIEFFAAAGLQYIILFLCTLPIYAFLFLYPPKKSIAFILITHILIAPLFVLGTYTLLKLSKDQIGWAMIFSGKSTVVTYYTNFLFYIVQFAVLHGYRYHRDVMRLQKNETALREAKLQSEIVALKSQLNPHFLHNLFNSINASLPPEHENTRNMIVQLSDLFRYQSYASTNDFLTISDEVGFICDYLDLMKVRFKERLAYTITVDDNAMSEKIIPMLLQPLVENAIIHGIEPKLNGGKVMLNIDKKSHSLHVEIIDTGVGIDVNKQLNREGLGLQNTNMLLNKIYNSELIIEKNNPCGTKLSFTIPTTI